MSTKIYISQVGEETEILIFESINISLSLNDMCPTCNLVLPFEKNEDISNYNIGSLVRVVLNDTEFKFWVSKPPKKLNGAIKELTLECLGFEARTQKIIVSDSYINTSISDIVIDLFTNYVPWATVNNIQTNARQISIKFNDVFLWDAMKQLCEISGFEWYIDNNYDVNFFQTVNNLNINAITENNFKRGTAEFSNNSDKLVNRLWIKGSKALSLPYTQNITVSGTTPIPLYYSPRATENGVVITVNGTIKTLGIENLTAPGTKDFLLNFTEKLLVPDLCISGTGTIVYSYEYPIKILIEDDISQQEYGLFEDVLCVNTDDSSLAREMGSRYLEKYSNPVITGNVEPFDGIYKPGELIKVDIPSLDIDEYLVVQNVNYFVKSGIDIVNVKLSLENTNIDLLNVLKNLNNRLQKIEQKLFNSSDASVEKYKIIKDTITQPKLEDALNYNLHNYLFCGTIQAGGWFV